MRWLMMGLCVSAMAMSVFAGAKSDRIFVHLEPEKSYFWQTATNNAMNLPVCFPEGATSAELSVKGIGFDRIYSDIKSDSVEVVLPAASSPSTENVYEFTLAFDNGITNRVRLGLIQGVLEDGRGSTRCLLPEGSSDWREVVRTAVLPIPYGVGSFKLDGVEIDTGLAGAQGWYAIGPLHANVAIDATMVTAEGEHFDAALYGKFLGFYLHMR